MIHLSMQQDWNSPPESLEYCLVHIVFLCDGFFHTVLSSRLVLWGLLFFFPNSFRAVFIGLFPVWRSWRHWHRRCVRKRTALPLFVTMGQGSVKPALLGMMLREQFSPPSWVVPGTRWWTALVIPHLDCRRFCCPIPSSLPRATFSCVWGKQSPGRSV